MNLEARKLSELPAISKGTPIHSTPQLCAPPDSFNLDLFKGRNIPRAELAAGILSHVRHCAQLTPSEHTSLRNDTSRSLLRHPWGKAHKPIEEDSDWRYPGVQLYRETHGCDGAVEMRAEPVRFRYSHGSTNVPQGHRNTYLLRTASSDTHDSSSPVARR